MDRIHVEQCSPVHYSKRRLVRIGFAVGTVIIHFSRFLFILLLFPKQGHIHARLTSDGSLSRYRSRPKAGLVAAGFGLEFLGGVPAGRKGFLASILPNTHCLSLLYLIIIVVSQVELIFSRLVLLGELDEVMAYA